MYQVDATFENCADGNPPVEGQCTVDATFENCSGTPPVEGQCTVQDCAFGKPPGLESNVCHDPNDDCPPGYTAIGGGNCRTSLTSGSCPPDFDGNPVTPQGQNCNTMAQCPGDFTDASTANTCVYNRECPEDNPPSSGQWK